MNKRLSIKQYIGLIFFKSYRETLKKLHPLQCLYWESTLDCNLNCLHCGSDCTKTKNAPNMPANDFIQVLKDIKKAYKSTNIFIGITGGEPLLRDDLESSIYKIRKLGFPVGIVTNGLLLSKSRFESLIEAGLNTLSISLDGLEDSQNWLRANKDSFQNALIGISLGGVYSSNSNFLFDVITCANPKNINQLEEMRRLLIKLNVKRWRIAPIFAKGRAKDSNELLLNKDGFFKLLNFIEKYKNRDGLQISYGCEGYLGNFEGKVRNKYFSCQSGTTTASILNDGSITGCVSLREAFVQGNIYNDNFIDVWENGFSDLRDRSWTKNGPCIDCKEFKWCDGGGLHLREGKNHDFLSCAFNKYT